MRSASSPMFRHVLICVDVHTDVSIYIHTNMFIHVCAYIYIYIHVWSCEGHCHPDVSRVMSFCAAALARRSGQRPQGILHRWRADIGVALAVRRARMAKRCLPQMSARERWVLNRGASDDPAKSPQADDGLAEYFNGQ